MPDSPLAEFEEEAYSLTRRKLVITTALVLCREVHEKRYHVVRGGNDWSAWNFETHPFGIMLIMDESSFLRRDNNKGVLTIEVMTKMPVDTNQLDDELSDDLLEDAGWVYLKLMEARDPGDPTFPVITRIDTTTDNAIEVSDALLKTQGIIATVELEF